MFLASLILETSLFMQIDEKTAGPGAPLSKESFSEAKSKLEALDKKDEERRRTAELKNSLEGYIYDTRDKVRGLISLTLAHACDYVVT